MKAVKDLSRLIAILTVHIQITSCVTSMRLLLKTKHVSSIRIY